VASRTTTGSFLLFYIEPPWWRRMEEIAGTGSFKKCARCEIKGASDSFFLARDGDEGEGASTALVARSGRRCSKAAKEELSNGTKLVMSTHAYVLVNNVGPPSAKVCRAAVSFP
jgi:hypothetical protein